VFASHAEMSEYVLISDQQIKVGEIPEPISFPEIKAEPDEMSYMSVCHQYKTNLVNKANMVHNFAPVWFCLHDYKQGCTVNRT